MTSGIVVHIKVPRLLPMQINLALFLLLKFFRKQHLRYTSFFLSSFFFFNLKEIYPENINVSTKKVRDVSRNNFMSNYSNLS